MGRAEEAQVRLTHIREGYRHGRTEEAYLQAAPAQAPHAREGGDAGAPSVPALRRSAGPAPRVPELRILPQRAAARRSKSSKRRLSAMRIALDAMGSDRAPSIEVEGAVRALRELERDFRSSWWATEARIEAELARHPDAPRERIEVVHAAQRIEMGEAPAQAIRRKPESSIVVGLNLQKQGEVDAFISAGSTGAVMAGSLVILRPLPGVDRPAIGTVLPTRAGPHAAAGRGRQRGHAPAAPGPVRAPGHHLRPGPDGGGAAPRGAAQHRRGAGEGGRAGGGDLPAPGGSTVAELRGQRRGARHHRARAATCWSATASWATSC